MARAEVQDSRALTGVSALLAQDFFDFSLEMSESVIAVRLSA